MKRRPPPEHLVSAPPPELLMFDADDWPGDDDADRWLAFEAARRAHLERFGWPGGEHGYCTSLPDQPWADWMI